MLFTHLVLFVLCVILLRNSFPFLRERRWFCFLLKFFKRYRVHLLILMLILFLHLLEVQIIDSAMSSFVGYDYAYTMHVLEDGLVASFNRYWNPILLSLFVLFYIIIYPFTLWFTPLYCILSDNKEAMKCFTYGVSLIYLVALPFYLFLPVSNVYTFYGLHSPLSMVIPGSDYFFYNTTTYDNCFPSLHVALAILISRTSIILDNKVYRWLCYISMVMVLISVVYLCVHWVADVIGGVLVSLLVIVFMNHYKQGLHYQRG